MTSKAEATFKITGWNEQTISELEEEGGKLKRAHVTKSYTGDLRGEGVVEYLMAYKADGSGTGALSGINGKVNFSAGHQEEYTKIEPLRVDSIFVV